jgi:hypothetical protein
VVAGVIAAAGLITGAVLLITAVTGALPRHTFAPGETVSVPLKRDPQPAFYVTDAGSPDDSCYALGPGGQRIDPRRLSSNTRVTVNDNGTQWHVISRLRLPSDGTYQVTCPKTATNAGARYAIGTPPKAARIAVAILIPVGALATALVITIITAVRRNAHRRRLMAPPPGYF